MRFMVMVMATKESEVGIPPKPEAYAAMGKYNAELVKAGVLLAAEGLAESSKGARVSEVDGRSDRVGEPRSEYLSERRGGGRDPQVDGCRGLR